jgi:RNA polymerase sigma-70 factor (ECF subfamily)
MKLVAKDGPVPPSRTQFLALSARIMRDVLTDMLRQQKALKRGGTQIAIPLDDSLPVENPVALDFVVLDDALRRLGAIKERYAKVVELRFFGGLTVQETALVLGVSAATIEREWHFSRAWLRRELSPGQIKA